MLTEKLPRKFDVLFQKDASHSLWVALSTMIIIVQYKYPEISDLSAWAIIFTVRDGLDKN